MAGSVGEPCVSGNLTTVVTPWGITVTVNKAVKRRFVVACKRAHELKWDPKRIDSYNCRKIRGSDSWSRHSYGCAWDFFYTGPGVPPPGGVWEPDDTFGHRFALCFTDLGFTWGGKWARRDAPHIEFSGSVVPRLTMKEWLRTQKAHKQRMARAKENR